MSWAKATWQIAVIGRWMARISGTVMALFLMAFIVGEGPPPVWRFSAEQNLHFVGLCALFLGLLLGLKWEFWGGAIPIVGFLLLGTLDRNDFGRSINLLPAAVGVLYLLCWVRLRAGAPPAGAAWQVPRLPLAIAGGTVCVFILLCANEMFGNPPLMTPALHAAPALVGEWRSPLTPVLKTPVAEPLDAALIIASDGSLSGTIGSAQVTGRISSNRSWFGRLMNWRYDYWIRGALSQPVSPYRAVLADRFTGTLMAKDKRLEGAFYLAGRPLRVRLEKR